MGGTGSGRKTTAVAVCPEPAHAGSRVKKDGRYGPKEHRRQMFRCTPTNGDPSHRFTETLPREESWTAVCPTCERPIDEIDGPQAAKDYVFVARGIAGALVGVGAGQTYRAASLTARERAHRTRYNPLTGQVQASNHAQLVADWVEVFAPVLWDHWAPDAWPRTGTLVLDHKSFHVSSTNTKTGAKKPNGKKVFDVYMAMGYEDGRPKLWHMEAFPSATRANWDRFLAALPGIPQRVVCDNHSGMTNAIRARWPSTDLYLCEWHLRHALERVIDKVIKDRKRGKKELREMRDRAELAFAGGKTTWPIYVNDLRALRIQRINNWLDKNDAMISAQFQRAGLRSNRPYDMPLSTGGLEAVMRPIAAALEGRRYSLKNRERTNRLLMLMALHANRLDSEVEYRTIIREWLEANQGRPAIPRRAVTDPRGVPSLRR